jgi:hypothetical protein
MLSFAEQQALRNLQPELATYGPDITLTVVGGDAVLTLPNGTTEEVRQELCTLVGAQIRSLCLGKPGSEDHTSGMPTDAFFAEYERTHPEFAGRLRRVGKTS